jgi:hypothetical protein
MRLSRILRKCTPFACSRDSFFGKDTGMVEGGVDDRADNEGWKIGFSE